MGWINMTAGRTTIKWSNYYKATPTNLLRWAQSIQAILAGASATTSFMELNKWIPIGTALAVIVVNQAVQFFGNVVHDMESATAQFPSGDEVTVTKEIKSDEVA